MTDHADASRPDAPAVVSASETISVEAYKSGDLTVLYDANDPLAWIESSYAVPLDEAA